MEPTLTITAYVGHDVDEVRAAIEADVDLVRAPLATALERAESFGAPSIGDVAIERDENRLHVVAEASDLDGASVAFERVGESSTRLTALTVALPGPFASGDQGRREYLAASLFVDRSVQAIEERLAA